jgi:glutamate formiminotransferase/formiminotetrahydrofolate cyclodeaminase
VAARPLIEIVPNFSEGRRQEVIDAIVEACQVPGALLLNRQWDPDHNRLDCTLIGDAASMRRSALAAASKATELIDMDEHVGSHPRMGAIDVLPFVPVRSVSMEECVQLARGVAEEIAETLGLPVYCYDQAAFVPERTSLAEVRKGEYEGLKADVAAGRRLPDFGPHEIGKAGAVAVGARKPLIAFNVYFRGDDEEAVKDVARNVRESSGGLKNVRAIGFSVPDRGLMEVSMNLVDHEATPVHRALELVRREAARHGLVVHSTEIVGLVPQAAIAESASFHLQLDGFDPEGQILENLVSRADAGARSSEAAERGESSTLADLSVAGFLEALSSSDATPGGGTAAALVGAFGASLVAMVGRVTVGKKAYEEVWERMGEIVAEADRSRLEFLSLAERDAEAFDAVMAAYRLPKESEDERSARARAIELAMAGAVDVPMAVARRAVSLLAPCGEVINTGNANAASDGAAAGHLLFAAAQGALRNVEINLASMTDAEAVERTRGEAGSLDERGRELLAATAELFRRRMQPA